MKKCLMLSLFAFLALSGSLLRGMRKDEEPPKKHWKNQELVNRIVQSDLPDDRKKAVLEHFGFFPEVVNEIMNEYAIKIFKLREEWYKKRLVKNSITKREREEITAEDLFYTLMDYTFPEKTAREWKENKVFSDKVIDAALRLVQEQRRRQMEEFMKRAQQKKQDSFVRDIEFFIKELKKSQDIDEAVMILKILHSQKLDAIECARQAVLVEQKKQSNENDGLEVFPVPPVQQKNEDNLFQALIQRFVWAENMDTEVAEAFSENIDPKLISAAREQAIQAKVQQILQSNQNNQIEKKEEECTLEELW